MPKSLTKDQKAMYAEFNSWFTFCWSCGVNDSIKWVGGYPATLQRHHIVKPGRETVRENIAMLCLRCHDLAHGAQIRSDGGVLPKLSLANVLWLKQIFDPKSYDRETLTRLYGKALPDDCPVAEWFCDSFFRWQTCSHEDWRAE